jgi:uridine phosphorylase
VPARLRPTAPIAADAILVGDPGRAMLLAQALLEEPKMSNHARGLWGYSGGRPTGGELTIQATGMGGPSAGLVLADLAELGVRRAIRVGTCTGLDPALGLGQLLAVEGARGAGAAPALPDAALSAALRDRLGADTVAGTVVSLDTLHGVGAPAPAGAAAADMQTATVLGRGRELGVAVAAVLIVTETESAERIDQEPEERAVKLAGTAAAAVLSI